MATNEGTEGSVPTSRAEQVASFVARTERAVTGTQGLHLRELLLVLVGALCAATAPVPWSFIGVLAMVALAASWPRR